MPLREPSRVSLTRRRLAARAPEHSVLSMSDTSLSSLLRRMAAEFDGRAGIAALNLATGEEAAIDAEDAYPTASMIKVLVLYELVRQCDRGAADWLERLTLRREDRTLGSGLLLDFSEGAALTLHDLAVLMMAISDNTATNMLIDRLGRGAINQACREAGLRVTELRGKVDFDRLRESNDNLGVTAPREFVRFIAAVRRGELIPEASAERMIGIMRIQKYIEPIRRLLPFSPYSVEFGDPCDVWVASKTGSLRGVRCEGGLVHTPRAEWTLCVMTKDSPDLRSSSDHAGVQFISRVSRAVFDAWS